MKRYSRMVVVSLLLGFSVVSVIMVYFVVTATTDPMAPPEPADGPDPVGGMLGGQRLPRPELPKAVEGERSSPTPEAAPLRIAVQDGEELSFYVKRSHRRSGRFLEGDTTEIDYTLRVEKVQGGGALTCFAEFDRIRFRRAGRGAIDFDSQAPAEDEAVLVAGLRDLIDKPIRVSVSPEGAVRVVGDFPAPVVPFEHLLKKSPVVTMHGAEKETEAVLRGSSQETRLARIFSLMLRFVVSPEVLRGDLQAIFAAGLQREKLAVGATYNGATLENLNRRKRRRLRHPGPVPLYDKNGQPRTDPSPREHPFVAKGNSKGRGSYLFRFVGPQGQDGNEELYKFRLVQAYTPQAVSPDNAASPDVGSASYRQSDGLLEQLAYRYSMYNESPRDSYSLLWEIDISRK